jgi:hypothetical protein
VGASFEVVRLSGAKVNVQPGMRSTLAYFGQSAHGLAIAEAMAPDAEESVLVFGDKDRTLQTELLLCFGCYTRPVCLAELKERLAALEAKE